MSNGSITNLQCNAVDDKILPSTFEDGCSLRKSTQTAGKLHRTLNATVSMNDIQWEKRKWPPVWTTKCLPTRTSNGWPLSPVTPVRTLKHFIFFFSLSLSLSLPSDNGYNLVPIPSGGSWLKILEGKSNIILRSLYFIISIMFKKNCFSTK